jgi:hypothetical protein
MAIIITRETGATAKDSPLSNAELDQNFINLNTELGTKQDLLVSATNIKTINGSTLLGSGNIEVSTSSSLATLTDALITNPVAGDALVYTGTAWTNTDRINAKTIYEAVKNVSGGALPKGTPVYQVGMSGNTVTVAAARADDPAKLAIGVLDENIASEAEGRMLVLGEIKGVDTSAFAVGDKIYLGNTGGYTNVPPATVARQFLGVVFRVSDNNGSGYITGTLLPDAVRWTGTGLEAWTGTAWQAVGGGSVLDDGVIYSKTVTTTSGSTDAAVVLDSWSVTTYRSAKYLVQIQNTSGYHSFELMLLHNNATVNYAQYADLLLGNNSPGNISVDIINGNVRLLVVPQVSAGTTTKIVLAVTLLNSQGTETVLPPDLNQGSGTLDLNSSSGSTIDLNN